MRVFPFNGVLAGSEIADSNDESLGQFRPVICVLRYGTVSFDVFGTVIEAYNWDVFERHCLGTLIIDNLIATSWPLDSTPNAPFWFPTSRLGSIVTAYNPLPVAVNFGFVVAPVPFIDAAGSRFFVPATDDFVGVGKIFPLLSPTGIQGVFSLPPSPIMYSFFRERDRSPNWPWQLIANQFPMEMEIPPTKFHWYGSWYGSRYVVGTIVNGWPGWAEVFRQDFFGGSTWTSGTTWTIELDSNSVLPPVVLCTPIAFARDDCEQFFTSERIKAINNVFGYEVIRSDGAFKVFGFYYTGSYEVEFFQTTKRAWLPVGALVDGWLKYSDLDNGVRSWVLEIENATPVPVVFITYAKPVMERASGGVSLDRGSKVRVWVDTSWQNPKYWEYWLYVGGGDLQYSFFDYTVEFVPHWPNIYLVRRLAEILEKLCSKRIIVLTSGAHEPLSAAPAALPQTLWSADGFIPMSAMRELFDIPATERQWWFPYLARFFDIDGARQIVGTILSFQWESGTFRNWHEDTQFSGTQFVENVITSGHLGIASLQTDLNYTYEPFVRVRRNATSSIGDGEARSAVLTIGSALGIEASRLVRQFRLQHQKSFKRFEFEPPFVVARCSINRIDYDGTFDMVLVLETYADWEQLAWFLLAYSATMHPLNYWAVHNPTVNYFQLADEILQEHSIQYVETEPQLDPYFPPLPRIYVSRFANALAYSFIELEKVMWHIKPHYYSLGTLNSHIYLLSPADGTTRLPAGVHVNAATFNGSKVPHWFTVWEKQPAKGTQSAIAEVLMPGHKHAHPATFSQLGIAVDSGSLSQAISPFSFIYLIAPAESFVMNFDTGGLLGNFISFGIDPIYCAGFFWTAPNNQLPLPEQHRLLLQLNPTDIDRYLRGYQSGFPHWDELDDYAGTRYEITYSTQPLIEAMRFVIKSSIWTAVGDPASFGTVCWRVARIPNFQVQYVGPARTVYMPPLWEQLWHLTTYWDRPMPQTAYLPAEIPFFNQHDDLHVPFRLLDLDSLSQVNELLGLPKPIEVMPVVKAVMSKVGVDAVVTPFFISLPHKTIYFPTPPTGPYFLVEAYDLPDGYIAAHVYSGSGVWTFVVDGNDIVYQRFDPLPQLLRDLMSEVVVNRNSR